MGWRFIDGDETQAFYLQAPRMGEDGHRVMWARLEKRAGGSTVSANEYDCAQGRTRQLQLTAFSANNLTGTSQANDRPTDWRFPVPGSYGDLLTRIACSAK